MYSEIVAAVQSTKTVMELIKAAHGLSNYSQLLTAVTEVQEKLTNAIASELASQEKQAALAERVRELEKKLAEIEDWSAQLRRYALSQFPTQAFAYALKPGMEQGEPHHFICATCVSNKHKSILQPDGRYLRCPTCHTKLATREAPPIQEDHGESWFPR